MLADIEGLGQVIDTSGLSANKLRAWIKDLVGSDHSPLTLLFESFAFKYGVPLDADLVFDVRISSEPVLRPCAASLPGATSGSFISSTRCRKSPT